MSWNILEKSKNGTIQYLHISHSANLSPDNSGVNSGVFGCLGYSNITIGYKISAFAGTNVKLILQGSNDGTNYFDIETNTHEGTGNGFLKLSSPVKFIKVNAITSGDSGTNTITSIQGVLTT